MICRIITIISMTFVLASGAKAQVYSHNYESFATHADKVVRGKITNAQKIAAYRGTRELSCGIYMEIEVVKSWKGGSENFTLYTTNSDVYMGEADGNMDREYLIFAFKNPKHSATERADEYVLCEGENSVKRNIAPFEYMSDSGVQRVFPIKNEPSSINEWMLVVNRSRNAELPENIQKRSVKMSNVNVIEEMSLAQFTDTFFVSPENN